MSTSDNRASAQAGSPQVDPQVWRVEASDKIAAATRPAAAAQAKATEQLPWQQRQAKPLHPLLGGVPGAVAPDQNQQQQEAAAAILGRKLNAPAQDRQAKAETAEPTGQTQAQGQVQTQAQAQVQTQAAKVKAQVSSLLRRKPKVEPRDGTSAAGKTRSLVAVNAATTPVAEIGMGARHLVTGAAEIVCGTLHGVVSSGRLALNGVAATGRYSLLGIKYGLDDSARLLRGAFGWFCPTPQTEPKPKPNPRPGNQAEKC
ncbi:MAG: hypothetical protein HQL47_05585 [Gammaproteobacteria bacterium]|nr:hypothetical protein [Gammaproteobacteria bacterium]